MSPLQTSPPPKPKNEQPKQERRTSWGLPLSLTRSSGHPNGQARQSKEFIPQLERPQAATTSSTRITPAPQLPSVSIGDSLGIMSGALPSKDGSLDNERQESPSARNFEQLELSTEDSEARDSLGVPAPIGKHQPSWDPYNAAPIAEEEVFQYEENPRQRQLSSDVGNRHGPLAVPFGDKSRSERSNSDDTHFYSAQEEESDNINDWVMVPPNPETKDSLPSATAVEEIKPGVRDVSSNITSMQELKPVTTTEPNNRKNSLDAPVTSMLNRPRGRSIEIPSTPPSATVTTPKGKEPATVVAAPRQHTPSPPKPLPIEPERQTGSSSFLPPIRRTSTFGLGFGSRHSKPRFALEDEDEQHSPDPVTEPLNAISPMKPIVSIPAPTPTKPSKLDAIPAPPSRASAGAMPQARQQAPASNQSSQSTRPLSFIQTSGAGEVLHTPFKSIEHKSAAADVLPPNPPEYVESQNRQEASPKDLLQVIDAQKAVPLQAGDPRPHLVQSTSSEHNQQSNRSQATVLPEQALPQKSSTVGSPDSTQVTEKSQREIAPPRASRASQQPQLPPLVTPRASDVLQRPEFRESQVEWRPNRQKASEPPPVLSPTFLKEVDVPVSRSSLEHQRQRGYSGSSPSYSHRPDVQYSERAGWTGSPIPQNSYPQPPSSAQRYPELFRPGQPTADIRDSVDLPAHYYQAPITRADAFLPRQQTSEYQIPGVGPPPDDPRYTTSRRNSGFFKEIGGKLSRASSRDRGNAHSRESGPPSPSRQFESRGNEYADSIVTSEAEQEQRQRRSSFFRHSSRNSTSGLEPPQSRESVIAHNSASRSDLLDSSQPSPTQPDRKRSFFGGGSKDPKVKSSKLARSSTGTVEPSGKKNRFSGLSGMFSKSSQSTRESIQDEHQPIESPQFNRNGAVAGTPPPNQGTSGQTRQVLPKFTSSPSPRSSPRAESKTRRSSAAGLLGGLIGRRSYQQERGSDDSRSQSSSQPRTTPQVVPPAQTYSDLQREVSQSVSQPVAPPEQRREIPFQDPSTRVADRGRQIVHEPQYDTVPIPGGYSLVRGQGAVLAPTQYDPRGLNRMQQVDPRYYQTAPNDHHVNTVPRQAPQQYDNDGRHGIGTQQPPPASQDPRNLLHANLHSGAGETHENHMGRSAPRRLSREDLLARSPPKSPEGQQRPYQISLPGGDEEDEQPLPVAKDDAPGAPTQTRLQHDALPRLQQPTLQHPESPAGYPLPEDTVFSPINPGANGIPPPPPPQWPGRMESRPSDGSRLHHERQSSLSTMDGDLDRSNTRRTAVSAVSGLSTPNPQTGSLNVPTRQISDATERDHDRRHLGSPSPSPPSPMPDTPDRNVSPELRYQTIDHEDSQSRHGDDIRTTEVMVKRSREDLYNASPRLPKPGYMLPRELTMSSTPANSSGNANMAQYKSNHLQPNGKENVTVNRSYSAAVPPTESKFQPLSQVTRAASSSQAQEEKMTYHDGIAGRAELPVATDDDGPPEMSAVSYPGMEW